MLLLLNNTIILILIILISLGFRAFSNLPDGRKVLAMEDCSISLGELIEIRIEDTGTPFEAPKILKVGKKYIRNSDN